MRICLIGNSQIACVKLGWERMALPDATFIAAPSKLPKYLQVEGDKLVAPEDLKPTFESFCGISEVSIPDHDAFILVGLNYSLSRCLDLFLSSRPYDPGYGATPQGYVPISLACYRAAAAAAMRRSSAFRIATRLRKATAAPIFIVPEPAVGETIKDEKSRRGAIWQELSAIGAQTFYDLFLKASATFQDETFTVVPQPPETIVGGAFTNRKYVTGHHTLSGALRQKNAFDHGHMTTDYGAIVARNVFQNLTLQSAT